MWITCRGERVKISEFWPGGEREVVDNLWIRGEETVVQKPHR